MKQESLDFLSNFKGLQIFVAADERNDGVPWHFQCSFEEAYPKLQDRQSQNWGVYFTVNELDQSLDVPRKRTKKMLKRIRAVFCEFDNKTDIPKFPLKPSIVVQTSEGKYHFYWLTTTENLEEWAGVQQCIVNNYGGDKNAKDLTRYLRIPGFLHCKREPHEVLLLENNGKQYPWETIKIAFPPESKEAPSTSPQVDQNIGGRTIKQHDEDIIFGRHFHGPMLAHMQRIKDGDPPYLIKAHLKNLFDLSLNFKDRWEKTETEWQHAYSTIDYQVDEYVKVLRQSTGKKPTAKIYVNDIPDFPDDCPLTWPEPWPLIWENYKKLPRTLDQCLLLPTVLCVHSFLLNAVHTTEWGKRPNMAFLNIAPSTGNKDVNSENVIRSMLELLTANNKTILPFGKMVNGAEGITSDTAFLQSFQDNDLFWVNTEATHLFQQMAQAGMTNSSVKALESKIIDVVDGVPIRGKRKAGKDGNVNGIDDPNAQILLYAQPETISAYLKGNMVDSGLLGRMIIHIPKESGEDPFIDSFKRREKSNYDIDQRIFKLYEKLDAKGMRKFILKPRNEDVEVLQRWMMEKVKPLSDGDHSVKMLKRLAISAEQLYVIIMGMCQKWDAANNKPLRTFFDVQCMFPLLEYWAKCKVYVLREFIDQSIDPLADSIVDIIAKLISQDIKPKIPCEFATQNNLTPKSEVYRVIRSRTKLKRELEAKGDTKNVSQRVYNIIDMLIKQGVLIETVNKQTTYIGFGPNYVE